jgi:uncharacterized protein YjbJ (UPF0337 family)
MRSRLHFASCRAKRPEFSPNDRDVVELQPHRGAVIARPPGGDATCSFHPQKREMPMNWDQIQGNWVLFKANVRGNWVKITDEDLTRIGGRRDELVKRLQARYGFGKGEAEREIEAWVKTQRHAA